jgi:hypothetical protein
MSPAVVEDRLLTWDGDQGGQLVFRKGSRPAEAVVEALTKLLQKAKEAPSEFD